MVSLCGILECALCFIVVEHGRYGLSCMQAVK